MPKVNLNELALDVAAKEGKRIQVNVAQIKELLRVVFTGLTLEEIVLIWFKYANKK